MSDMKKAVLREARKAYRYFLEPGISDTVAVLNLLGFHTQQSCEGHLGHGTPAPWIHVAASNEPRYYRVRMRSVRRHIATTHGLRVREVGRGPNETANDLFWDSFTYRRMGRFTPQYRHWLRRNASVRHRLVSLVCEYNAGRPGNERVRLEPLGGVAGRVTVGFVKKQQVSLSRSVRARKLHARQGAMKAFALFLQDRYLQAS